MVGWTKPDSIMRNIKISATMFCSYKDILMDPLGTVLNVLHNEFMFHSYSTSCSFFFSVHYFINLLVSHFLFLPSFTCLILLGRQPYCSHWDYIVDMFYHYSNPKFLQMQLAWYQWVLSQRYFLLKKKEKWNLIKF